MKYLDSHCTPGKCCICARECLCFTSSEDQFVLAHKWEIEDRLKRGGPYQVYEIALMRKTLDDMTMEERETKEKEKMVSIKTVDIEKEKAKARDEGYKAGLEEAWGIARKLGLNPKDGGYNAGEVDSIFGSRWYDVLLEMSIHEVKEKIAAYEADQAKPKLGDVVNIDDVGEFLFLGEGSEHYYVLDPSDNDGIPHQFVIKHTANSIRKTGKHFNIQSMLDEIG